MASPIREIEAARRTMTSYFDKGGGDFGWKKLSLDVEPDFIE